MAARPSPAAVKARKELEASLQKQIDISEALIRSDTARKAAESAVVELRETINKLRGDTNSSLAAQSEIQMLRKQCQELQENLGAAHDEKDRLRSLMANLTHGGVHLKSIRTVD